eukprot:1660575-Rhodomonas_salina.1
MELRKTERKVGTEIAYGQAPTPLVEDVDEDGEKGEKGEKGGEKREGGEKKRAEGEERKERRPLPNPGEAVTAKADSDKAGSSSAAP